MNHPEVRRRMGDYLEGDLPLAQRALFDAHLDGCEACATDLRALRETVQLLRELPSPEVPPHLTDRIVARIADGEGRARWWDGLAAFWDWIDPARYLPPLAAASLTSAVLIVGVRDYGWQIPGAPAPAAVERELADSAEETLDLRMQPRLGPPGRASTASGAPERALSRGAGLGAALAAPPLAVLEEADAEVMEIDVIDDPHLFLERYRALQEERRADWLAQMAQRAARGRKVEIVVRRLREDAGPEGRALAEQFEAVAYPANR